LEFLYDLARGVYSLDSLIQWGGYTVLFAIVFAETGLLIGFFLPGDSLLVTAGLVASAGAWGRVCSRARSRCCSTRLTSSGRAASMRGTAPRPS